MKCKRAKQEMALGAGRDLDPATEQELRRHLVDCPGCQDQWNRIRSSTAILHQVSVEEAEVPAPRLWSNVSNSIRATSGRRTSRSEATLFSHGLVPLVAVASLVLAVISINHTLNNPPASQPPLAPLPPNGGTGIITVEHTVDDAFGRRFLQDDGSSVVVPSPMERILRDRDGYQMTPAPGPPRIQSLPGGNYLQEE